MKIFVIIYFKLVYLSVNLYSQPTLEWARLYNGPSSGTDIGWSIFVDDSAYVYVTGLIASGSNRSDRGTIKYKPNGDSVWVRLYGEPNTIESGSDLFVDTIGNVFVTGIPNLQKYDMNGNLIWTRNDSALGTIVGGIKLLKNVENKIIGLTSLQNYYYVISKYNPTGGDTLFRTFIRAKNNPYDMAIDKQGNIYISGIYNGPFPPNYQDFCVVKCGPDGDSLWSWIYNGTDPQQPFDAAYAITVDDSGYVYATGGSDDINGTGNWFTVKLTPDGDTLWTRRFNIGGSYAYNIDADRYGNIYVSGITNITRATVVKYSSSGAFQWSRTLPNTMIIGYQPLQTIDSNGSVYITATSENFNGSQLVKYSSMGEQLWFINHIYTEPRDIMVKNNYVYVTGGYYGVDMITLKYSQPIGIVQISTEIPSSFKLFQNYPNPFNPDTKIRFQISKAEFIILKIYDILGRQIRTLVMQHLTPGIYETGFNAVDCPSGIYFCKMISEDYSETIKLTLVK